MSDTDSAILSLKYASPRIGTMNQVEVIKACKVLLLKIHVITGWVIPANELMIILIDQFGKKLIESYPMLNVDEIEYAFRNQGTTIKDWGKEMNLNLLDQVLIPYLDQRLQVSAMEERNSYKPEMMEQKILTDEQLENIHREDIENFYQRLRGGWIPEKMPKYFEEQLQKDGLLTEGENLNDFFVRKLGANAECLYRKDI